jgi:predicted dehydrogenase
MIEKKYNFIKRRDFLKTATMASAGVMLSSVPVWSKLQTKSSMRKKYVIVGTGSRSRMFQKATQTSHKQFSELVGLCDVNIGRLKNAQRRSKDYGMTPPPVYDAKNFDKMIKEQKPDVVIVTTVDGFHHDYIIRSMKMGCDVITEKPMTTNAEKCQAIIDTQKETGRQCRVTFNYRYSPARTQLKELLMSGVIGDVLSVDFHWMLNTFHGADYFRRWHSHKVNSGGLMVHKATHHFDLMNWWLSAIPVEVTAIGKREFYTPQMAKRMGLQQYHERCHTCPEKDKCSFELDLETGERLKRLYLDNEKYDGYYRDRCVFRPDIDIEDTMNVIVRYDNSVTMTYSLNAFNSWEGNTIVFNGTKGRIQHRAEETVYINGTDTVQGGLKKGGTSTKIIPIRGEAYEIDVLTGTGGHGGGDKLLLDDLFLPEIPQDKYMRAADFRSGAYSILIGVAANRCFETGEMVKIEDLVKGIAYPDYPQMPSRTGDIPMPGKSGWSPYGIKKKKKG